MSTQLTRDDGAEVHVVVSPPLSHPSTAGSDPAVEAVRNLGADCLVLDIDDSRQAFLSPEGSVPLRPTAKDIFRNGFAKQRFLQLQDDAMRLGLVPYGGYAAARQAAEESGAQVVLGGKSLDATLDRLPIHSLTGLYMSSGARDLTAALGSDRASAIDRAFYVYDHPEMRRTIIDAMAAEAQMPSGWSRDILGGKAYAAAVEDPAKVMVDAVRKAEGRKIVAVVPSAAHGRAFASKWNEQFDVQQAMRGGSFFDRYGFAAAAAAVTAAGVALVVSRRSRGASAFTKAIERSSKLAH